MAQRNVEVGHVPEFVLLTPQIVGDDPAVGGSDETSAFPQTFDNLRKSIVVFSKRAASCRLFPSIRSAVVSDMERSG